MIDTRNLIVIEQTAHYASLTCENTAMKKDNGILIGCLTVMAIAFSFVVYVEYKRQKQLDN